MKMKSLAVAFAALLAPSAVFAGTAAANFQVTLNITGACSLTATDLDFGTNVGGITTQIDASSQLQATCTGGTAYSVGLNNGTTSGATASVRKMVNAADNSTVNYSLYTTTGRTTVWDNNCATPTPVAASCVGGTGNNSAQTLTVYGRVAATQPNVTIGTYRDTVTATLTF